MPAAGAGVGHGRAVWGGEGDAPASTGMPARRVDDGAGLVAVEQAPGAGLGGGGRPPEEGAGRDDEVDEGRHRNGTAVAGELGCSVGAAAIGVAGAPFVARIGAGFPEAV